MLAPSLHPFGGNGPDFLLDVDLIPRRAEQFTRTRRREDCKFQRARRNSGTPSEVRHEGRDGIIGERRMMAAREPLAFRQALVAVPAPARRVLARAMPLRSEEHTSELQALMRISSAVFWLTK